MTTSERLKSMLGGSAIGESVGRRPGDSSVVSSITAECRGGDDSHHRAHWSRIEQVIRRFPLCCLSLDGVIGSTYDR